MSGLVTVAGVEAASGGAPRRWLGRRLEEASRVLYDTGIESDLLDGAGERGMLVGVDPAEDLPGGPIVEAAVGGRNVVRLRDGDLLAVPGVGQLLDRLSREGVAWEALAGRPAPDDDAFAVLAGSLLRPGGMLVVPVDPVHIEPLRAWLSGARLEAGLGVALLRDDRPELPAHLVGSTAAVAEALEREEAASDGLLLLGPPERVGRAARWHTRLPLLGLRVLVTRTADQAGGLARGIRERGGEPVLLPTIEIAPPPDSGPLDRALERLEDYDWLLFPSANAVRFFFDRLLERGLDGRSLAHLHVACVGSATSGALEEHGLRSDLVPEEHTADALAELLLPEAKGRSFLMPRALDGREVLPDRIREGGGTVDDPPAYANRPPEDLRRDWERAVSRGLDAATFTSPSTLEHLAGGLGVKDLGDVLKGVVVACIGPVTASAAKRLGLEPTGLPEEYTAGGLVALLEREFGGA
jgi:uroporphyrinogen III methyltransferase/synthase